ncbi:MAG: hypothetical protein GY858_05575 [Candidatus Omnitrophica bacterium]|nr:hypothetical protein [Candidatus Omnitrophota bacterium]
MSLKNLQGQLNNQRHPAFRGGGDSSSQNLHEAIRGDLINDMVSAGFVRMQYEGPTRLEPSAKQGTLQLGGVGAGDGALSVKDDQGTEIVLLNQSGMTINSGSISINDQNGSNIIDAEGLVSSTQFANTDTIDAALGQVIDGTATVDVTNSEYNIVLEREALCFFPINIEAWLNNPGTHNADLHCFLNVNGSVAGGLSETMFIVLTDGGANDNLATYSTYHIQSLPAGTNVVKLQANLPSQNGTASAKILRFKHSYIQFGK